MIDELYKYYCKNLTYNSCVLKLIPWYIRRPLFLSLYIALILAALVTISPILPKIDLLDSTFPILSKDYLPIILLSIAFFLMAMPFVVLNYQVKKVIKNNNKLRHIFDYEKNNWSRQKFRLYLLQNLERYLVSEKIQANKLSKIIEALQYQIDKERRRMLSFFISFGILIVPIWEMIVKKISSSLEQTAGINLLVILILFVVFLSILRYKLEYVLNDYYKIHYVGLSNLRDLLLELQISPKIEKKIIVDESFL